MNQYELNFNDYWRIIKKKKWLIIFTMFMVTIFSILFTIINQPDLIYRSKASIQIEKNTSLTGLYMESVSWGYGGDLVTRAEVIKSYRIVEKAAQKMGKIDPTLTSEEIKSQEKYFSIIENLKSMIKTEQEGYTNIINIIVESIDPLLAADLANTLVETYQEENFAIKNAKIQNAIYALEAQLNKAEEDYRKSESILQEFSKKHNLLTLEGKSNLLSGKIVHIEEKIEQIESDILLKQHLYEIILSRN